MKNKFTHNVTLRELIEICNQIKPDAHRNSTYISFKTYLPETRLKIMNEKRLIRKNGEYSLPIGSEVEADNIINISQNHHIYRDQNSSFEIEWIFSDEQRKYSQIKITPKQGFKIYINYLATMKDTSLPENCTFRIENVIDLLERMYLHNYFSLKYYDQGNPEKFHRKLSKLVEKYCKEGILRSIIINKTQYYEPM